MKKTYILALAALLLTSCEPSALRESPGFEFFGNFSWQGGTIEPGYGNRWIIRDSSGRRLGTVEPNYGGRFIIRDTDGRRVGIIEGR